MLFERDLNAVASAAEFRRSGIPPTEYRIVRASQARVAVDAMTGGTTVFGSRWVPRFLDTDPPVAAVGWMEHEASEAGLEVGVESEVAEMVTADDKTVAQPSKTLIKIIADRSTKQIRGCVAIGNQASEVTNLAALAIQSGISTREIERLLLVHPSASVAFQRCATKFHQENRWHPSIMNVLSTK